MAGTQKTYQVRFEVRGFSAVAKSFSALNKDMEQTLKSYRTIGNVQARDSRGRFVKNRFALSSNNRFSQSENSTRFSSQGGLLWDRQRGASVERTAIEYAANIQGSIIGEHISKALRVTSDRRQNIAGTRTVLRDAFEFALTSTMSGAFQRMGEAAIADPILNAMRQAFQENRKLEKRGIHPAIKGGSSGIGFAAKSVAFGGLQLIGSKFSEVLTEDLMRGFKRGFEKTGKNRAVNFEKLGESAGSFVSDPLAVAKDKIRERKISKLDDSLAEAEKLSRDQKVTVKPGKVKVFTVGGLGGSGIADYNENLARIGINPDIADIENTENPHTGTNIPLSDPLRFASDAILNKYVTNEIVKGQNQDAINLAAKVIAARRENPNARINLLGHSAGADIVQQAIAILEKGGYADNVQGIGVGGINIGTGFDVKNFRNIAGDNDYVVKATSAIGSQPTATDYGQVSKLGDHKLRTYFAHPDFIKSLDKDLQPTAVAKILDNFYEDMIQEYGNEALPVLEEALRDGLKFAGEFDRNFGNEETDRINQVLAKYHQQLGMPHQGINAKANPASIVNRQFERIEEVRSLFRGIHQQPDRGSPQQSYQVMSPDPLSPLNYQFMQPDPLNPVPLTTNAVNRVDQGNVDQQFDRVAEMMAGAKERARAMLPSQLAARQQGAPVRSNDVPQLVVAYQQKIIRSFKENLKAQMESMFASMEALAQSPTDDGGDEFANQLRLTIRQRAKGIFAAYTQAIRALEGVSVSADQVDNTTLDQVKTDFNAIVSEFQQAVTERVVETIGTLDALAQSYASEAPAAVAGAGGNRFVEDFNAQIDDQVMTFQANLDRLFGQVLETNAKKLDDLAALRAQMGLPRLASQRSLGDRYGERLQGLIQGAKTSAGQRIRGLIPGFESMDPKQRSEQLKKLRSEMAAGLNEFRRQMAAGDSATARKLGESLVQRIEAVRAAYDDLSKNFTGDKRAIGGSKAQLTKLSKELQQGLQSIAANATGSLAGEIESELNAIQAAGAGIGDALIEGTEDSLEISSPSKVFQRIGANIARGLGIGLRENLEEVKQDLTDNLSELGEESAFQATRVVNKFNDTGGFPGLDEKAAEGIDLVRDRLSGLAEEFPAIGQLVQIATQFGGSIALLMGAFSGLGKILQLSGFSTFISAIATLPDTAADAGRELQSLAIAFESVTGSSALSADAMEYISRTAEKFGISIRSAEEAYLGLVATTRGTELEGLQTDTIFEAFAQTAALRGLDEQQQQQMFTAVQQVLGKGKLSAEEVRGQLGEIPALAFQQTLAESLGVNLQQLDKLLSSGSLQSDAIFKVAQQYASANAQMAGSAETAQAAITRLDNAVIKLQRSFGSQFLEIQRKGALFFAGALEKLAGAAETIVKVFGTGLVVVLADVVLKFFASHLATKLLRIALVALGNAIAKLGPLLRQMAGGIVAVNVAIELWNVSLKQLELDDAEKGILNLSDAYTKLGGSIEGVTASTESMKVGLREIVEAAQSGNIGKALRLFVTAGADETREDLSGLGGFLERFKIPGGGALRRFFGTSTAEADLNRRLAFASAGGATSAQVQVDQQQAMKSADRMIQIEQQMVAIKTRRASLTAADGEELERTNELLKELREEYNGYLQQVSNARQNTQAQLTASKAMLDRLRADRAKDGLSEQEKRRLDAAIQETEQNIRVLENGQDALDQAVSRLDTSLSTFTTILARTAERIANIRERLTNEFNEYRAALIKTGLSLGSGDQTIRLELDRADFRELEAWIRTLRQESQRLTEQLQGPDLQPQVENLRKAALEENVEFGSAFFQRIANDTSAENREAAQALLQLQDLENQIAEGEVQLAQNTLQARQTIRDLNRQIADFIQQLTAELDGLLVDLREQVLNLAQSLRRTQLQKAIVGGSKGLFGSVVGSVQGFLDAAGQLAQQYLGQERRKLEFEQKKYDLGTRMREFIDSIGGATDAVQKFIQALGGGSAGAAVPSTARGGETFLGITGNSGRSTGPHLDIRKRGGDRRLTAAEIDRFRVDGKPLSSYPITSEFGPRWGTHHGGVDFGTSVGQKITTTVPVERVSMREPSQTGGGGYVVDVLFADGLEVSLLHLSPDIKTAGVGRSAGGSSQGVARVSGNKQLTPGQLVQVARAAGFSGDDAAIMAAIAMAESSGNPRAHNPNYPDNSYGLWQINMLGGMGPERRAAFGINSNEALFDPATNAAAAKKVFDWQGFGAWSVYSSGAYRQFLDETRSAANAPVAPGATVPRAETAQAQELANNILGTQRSMIATGEGELSVGVMSLQQQAQQTIQEIQQFFADTMIDLSQSSTQLTNQVRNLAQPDTLETQLRSSRETFTGINLQFRDQILKVGNSITELEGQITQYDKVLQQLKESNDPLDQAQVPVLEESIRLAKVSLPQLQAMKSELERVQTQVQTTADKEYQYLAEKIRLETENAQIQIELEQAQTARNSKLETELSIQQERNNYALQILDNERELSGRPDELAQRLEALRKQEQTRIKILQLQGQARELESKQFVAELDSRIAEAEATQAESFGGDNGIFGFRATELREQNALLQEQLRYEQEILDLRIRYVEQPDVLGDMLSKAERLNTLNLQNIDSQFKSLGETIAGVAEENLGQFFEDIFSGTKSAGEAFRNLAQSILRYFAQIAARNLTRGIFSRLGSIFGGAFGGGGVGAFTSPGGWSGFKYGGTVPNYAQGGRVLPEFVSELLKEAVPGVKTAFIREGSKAALGVFTPGEEVLSLRTGEAQRYQLLKKSLGDNPLQSIIAGSFAFGGTVGINPEILSGNFALNSPRLPISSVVQMGGGRSSFGGNVTINYEVKTPDANSFRRSQFQIDRDATIAAQKVLNRK
jgi:tape measure domain-containing protein